MTSVRSRGSGLEGLDTIHGLFDAVHELLEVFAVEEDLVLLEERITVVAKSLLALGDRQVILVRFGAFDIEEIGSLAGTYRLGEYFFAVRIVIGHKCVGLSTATKI